MTKQEKVERLIAVFNEARRSMSKGFQWTSNVSKSQCDVLWEVNQGTRRVVDLAGNLQTSSSAMTQLVHQLVAGGYLKRDASTDRRESILSVTAAGQKVLEQIRENMRRKAEDIANVLNDEELEQYISITTKIYQHLKEKGTA